MESFNPVLRHLYLQLLNYSWRIKCYKPEQNIVLISLYNENNEEIPHQYALSSTRWTRYYFGCWVEEWTRFTYKNTSFFTRT
jgi:hypothetical protein